MGRFLLRAAAGVTLAIVVLLLVGIGALYVQGRRPPAGSGQYVALGSSFSAGPGVGQRVPGSPVLCMRSADNYAHQLAAMRHLELTDVTCSGSTTLQLLNGTTPRCLSSPPSPAGTPAGPSTAPPTRTRSCTR